MPLRDDLLNEIPGDNPGGANLRYEPIYDQIKEARREVDAVPEGADESERKVADFKLVAKLAGDALAKQSKDLWLAAWLTEAVLKREGVAEFRGCLETIAGLLEKFWDHLHPAVEDPEDIELRSAPLSWVGQYLVFPVHSLAITKSGQTYLQYKQAQTIPTEQEAADDRAKAETRGQAVADEKLTPEEFETGFAATPKQWYKDLGAEVAGCLAAVDAIGKQSDVRFADIDLDERPTYRPLRDALREVQGAVQQLLKRKLEHDPDPVEEVAEEEESEGAATPGGGDAVVSIDPSSAKDAATRIAAAARFLQADDPTNPASYLMLRGFRWGELRVNGKDLDPRLLSAPPTPVREKLKRLLLDGKWDQLLAAAEVVMAQSYGRGWLDLQRYVLTACNALGSAYDQVAAAIRGALASLLRDIPNLPQLTLMDDTQTANAETRAWLREQLATEEAAGRVAISLPDDDDGGVTPAAPAEAPEALFERATSLMRGGRPEKGIELLLAAAEKEKSPRDRFLRRAQAASIMVGSGHAAIALPILRDLSQLIDTHHLEQWESGDTVARPLGLLYQCLNALQAESEDARNDLYLRICRLDPIQAMTFRNATGAAAQPEPHVPAEPLEQPAAESDGEA